MNEQAQQVDLEGELAVSNTIETPESDVQVDVIDDRPLEDQKPPRASASPDDDVDEEIAGISDRTKKRINKLKYDNHETRRAKEQAERML